MNILYICQVFETGNDPGSDRHFYFSKHAVKSGHNVTAITSNIDYKNACVRKECRNGKKSRNVNGVNISYVYSYSGFRGSYLKRLLYYLSFIFFGLFEAVKVRNVDVIYAVSTPLTVGLMGAVVSIIRRKPFVFEVTDVWPDAAVECGVVKHKTLLFLARKMEKICYQKAKHIIGLTSGICENIQKKGIARGKISLITNGVDEKLYENADNEEIRKTIREKHGIDENQIVAMYMGAHGKYNSLETIIQSARLLKDKSELIFIFIGDGDEKQKLEKMVNDELLLNVKFLDPVPRDFAASFLSMADLFLLPNRKGEFFKCNLPNKLFDYCASARPVILAGKGESALLVENADCGMVVPPEDPAAFSYAINKLAAVSKDNRLVLGRNGRDYVFENYNRLKLSQDQLDILSNVAAG